LAGHLDLRAACARRLRFERHPERGADPERLTLDHRRSRQCHRVPGSIGRRHAEHLSHRLPSAAVRLPTRSPTGPPACPREISHSLAGATVVPGRTSAAVTFYNQGGSDLIEYRITAISQDVVVGRQRDVGWTVMTPGSGCGFLTATVSGLDPKTHYVFSVDAVTTKIGQDGTQAATVARSLVVRTT